MEIPASLVKELREKTGVGVMDCKKALKESESDIDQAIDYLRKKGIATAKERGGRVTSEGQVRSYIHAGAKIGVLVEVNCETDFTAKTEVFSDFVMNIAMHIAAARPKWITRDDVPEDAIADEKRLIAAQAVNEGKPEHIVEKIVEGRLNSFFADNVLYDQEFVKTDTFDGTVGELVKQLASKMGENITVSKMARLAIGEDG